MVEVLLPFTILPLSAVLARIDISLIDQAQSLGASPLQTFLRVTLPLSLPGLAAGSVLAFISAMGSFATRPARRERGAADGDRDLHPDHRRL